MIYSWRCSRAKLDRENILRRCLPGWLGSPARGWPDVQLRNPQQLHVLNRVPTAAAQLPCCRGVLGHYSCPCSVSAVLWNTDLYLVVVLALTEWWPASPESGALWDGWDHLASAAFITLEESIACLCLLIPKLDCEQCKNAAYVGKSGMEKDILSDS